ncbi:MAG TPA: chemotaxis protein CheW [Thermoanaerobaculia bacterium]|nr:chemotaxis protein CheW [Thermoanaerobaculia bacterium]
MERDERAAARGRRHLLVRAGDQVCALPLASVRRVVKALAVHPLPGAGEQLAGLTEFGGEPLPVLDLARLVGAGPGPAAAYPVTVLAWAGPADARQAVAFAADAALEVVEIPPGAVAGGGAGGVAGEANVEGEVVRVLDLVALARGGSAG